MERKCYQNLVDWKKRPDRKPLVMYGVRQVGKTYLLQAFGEREFSRCHYVNFERDIGVKKIFDQSLDPRWILQQLEFYLDAPINRDRDLLIFDEIQACPPALTSLKYFCEELPQLALVSAGSLLGLNLNHSSFPVGKVDLMTLYPMSFEEFLMALADGRGLDAFRSISWEAPPSEIVHEHLWNRLKQYFVVGGMPEVVRLFRDGEQQIFQAMEQVRHKQEELVTAYLGDMAKHSGKQNAMHLERTWRSVVQQLGQSQDGSASKFKFRGVIPGISHYSRLAGAIDWLCATGLVLKVHIVQTGRLPLSGYTQENRFKLFCFDVGILGSLAGLAPKVILGSEYGSYKGFFAENFVAQAFVSAGNKELFSWQEKQAEVEFIRDFDGVLVPIEVKSGQVTKAKSLDVFCKKYRPPCRVIISARPMRVNHERQTYYCPLYFTEKLSLR